MSQKRVEYLQELINKAGLKKLVDRSELLLIANSFQSYLETVVVLKKIISEDGVV